MDRITGKDNKRIKHLISLRDKPRQRRSEGVFIAEGERIVRETPAALLRELYVSESFLDGGNTLPEASGVTIVSDALMEHISDTKTPQGILAVIECPSYEKTDILGKEKGRTLVFVLENVRDPGNLGTIIRTAEGAGATGLVLTTGCVDIFSPKVIRSTVGSIFRLPFVFAPSVADIAPFLKESGALIYAAHLGGQETYDRFDYKNDTVFLMGNEANGLSEEAASCADKLLIIPMHGELESLNVAMAAGILGYEADRQRRVP